ncbi:hypothetical protein B0T22DRAFT_151214 [Podospora appendiculata]|uniref:SH3 domain-containing protein n=1 Tax=Podospora appendiculata TaxID=314037 RepID=A0AAE0X999_9PEZI|nr:hypothetical protein B0T22DRAFT_151214 [Podospora appendiculata]
MIAPEQHHELEAPVTEQYRTNHLPSAGARDSTTRDSTARSRLPSAMEMSIGRRSSKRKTGRGQTSTKAILLSLLSTSSTATAACISLQGSKACPAFQSSSVSTSNFLVGLYSFLGQVTDRQSFDTQLQSYVQTTYIQEKYQTLLGCGGISLTNTTNLYSRFTTTVICNAIIQNSIADCSLSADNSRPVCADTCAQFALSEGYITADNALCANAKQDVAQKQIRADFTNCALPAGSLTDSDCIQGIANEPENCGYAQSIIGLCQYCASGGLNSTDTCCYASQAQTRCKGVVLPDITSPSITFSTPTATATATSTVAPVVSAERSGLSTGALAGVVVGSLAGAVIFVVLLILCWRRRRRARGSQNGSVFNQPSPARQGPSTVHVGQSAAPQGYEVLPGGRIARMSALEGHSGDSPSHHAGRDFASGAAGAAAAYAAGSSRRRGDDHSSSDGFGDSPESDRGAAGVLRPPPVALRRNGSLSSSSALGGEDPQSPTSAGGMSSPQGMASQQSEQLPFFKDYYSQDDIHPGDRVAVLWAYQPRAADEFTLDRGDMLKVVGIWDDGWATGILVDERTEEWEARRQAQRDSGVSNTSGRMRDTSPPVSGEIKAFPLVCVCLPEHWRKTIEGEGSTETGSSAHRRTTTSGS